MSEDKILWKSRTDTSNTFIQLAVVIGAIAVICIFLFGLLQAAFTLSNGSFKGVWVFLIVASIPILIIILKISSYINLIITAYTIEYYITNKGIFTEWGLVKKKHSYIDFKSITRVSMVNYKNGTYSTLFIEVKNKASEPGVNFVTGKSRHCPTMEKVFNGKKAFEIMEKLRLENQNR